LFEKSPDAIFIEDMDGTVLDCNPAAAELHGTSCEELIGKNVRDLVPNDRRDALITLSTEGPTDFEGLSLTLDGRTIPVSIRTSKIDYMGRPALLLHVRDITEKKREMEVVSRLAGGVAHDFNNLLTVIIGRCEVLLGRTTANHPMRQDIVLVHDAAQKAAAITRQLLAFGRKQVLKPRVLELNEVVRNMDMILRSLSPESIELYMKLSPALRNVEADPGQIEQVIMNLVVNGVDAMPHGGKLIIETSNSDDGRYVNLSVKDSGRGMDSETLSHIFEPFFTTKDKARGTGLGLSTVYGIIKQSGGHISAASEPNKGTAFNIALPATDRIAEPLEEARFEAPRGNETILIAEDADMVRELTREILEAYGYRVLEAPDGESALEICKTHAGDIQVMLTDVVMPRMDGRQLAQEAARLRPGMKVLFMSGYSEEIGKTGILDPNVHFIEKPFTTISLAVKIRDVIDG